MVHFYLVLLLIVLLPDNQSTVIIVMNEINVSSDNDKGKVTSSASCASESEYSASLSVSLEASSQKRPCISEDRGISLKKSLRYYVNRSCLHFEKIFILYKHVNFHESL